MAEPSGPIRDKYRAADFFFLFAFRNPASVDRGGARELVRNQDSTFCDKLSSNCEERRAWSQHVWRFG